MILAALVLLPFAGALIAFTPGTGPVRRPVLFLVAAAHLGLVGRVALVPPSPIANGWIGLDAAGLVFLATTSALFLAVAIYAIGYLALARRGPTRDFETLALRSTDTPEGRFIGCLLLVESMTSLVALSQNLGLVWVGVEATTLASTPLIYFHRHHRSLEATWKYLLICSVGIGLALFGNLCLAVAASVPGVEGSSLLVADLAAQASRFDVQWLQAAFIFLLIGYGTKMGLAPMHAWLPDAYSEAPSLVAAILSGSISSIALLALLRSHQVLIAAGQGAFGGKLLVVFGLLSMGFGAAFILNQRDFKRMLAWSSVEHMGILAVGVGTAGAGAYGAMLHVVNHSLVKGLLFLVGGNLLAAYQTKTVSGVRGALSVMPVSSVLWVAGFLAITGSPPFGTFLSEFTILKAMIDQGHPVVAAIFLLLLGVVFAGMASVVLPMVQGPAPTGIGPVREPGFSLLPPVLLGAGVLVLGLHVPPFLAGMLAEAARALGGP